MRLTDCEKRRIILFANTYRHRVAGDGNGIPEEDQSGWEFRLAARCASFSCVGEVRGSRNATPWYRETKTASTVDHRDAERTLGGETHYTEKFSRVHSLSFYFNSKMGKRQFIKN